MENLVLQKERKERKKERRKENRREGGRKGRKNIRTGKYKILVFLLISLKYVTV